MIRVHFQKSVILNLPFGLARSLVSDDPNVSYFAAIIFLEELVNALFIYLQMESVDQDCAVLALGLLLLLLGELD